MEQPKITGHWQCIRLSSMPPSLIMEQPAIIMDVVYYYHLPPPWLSYSSIPSLIMEQSVITVGVVYVFKVYVSASYIKLYVSMKMLETLWMPKIGNSFDKDDQFTFLYLSTVEIYNNFWCLLKVVQFSFHMKSSILFML